MSNHGRPLSPHISIYRWPITMTLSILHRMTGVAMSFGFVLLVAWLFDAAAGEQTYIRLFGLLDNWLGCAALIGWSFAFFYHFSNGIRHLFWDTGRGFEKSQANASAWFVLAASVVMTALFWWVRS